MTPKPKLDEQGKIVVDAAGMPVYVWDDGKEAPVDVGGLFAKVTELNGEAKDHRLRAEAAEGKLKVITDSGLTVEGLPEFITNANKALETVKNLEAKQLVDAGEVEKIKSEAAEAWKQKLNESDTAYKNRIAELEKNINEINESTRHLVIKGHFDRSQYIQTETFLDPDVAFDHWGRLFNIEGDVKSGFKVFAVRPNGEKIFSRARPGEYATPEEALEVLINESPGKDKYIKNLATGSGAGSVVNVPGGGKAVVLTTEEAKNPQLYRAAKERAAKEGVQLQIK